MTSSPPGPDRDGRAGMPAQARTVTASGLIVEDQRARRIRRPVDLLRCLLAVLGIVLAVGIGLLAGATARGVQIDAVDDDVRMFESRRERFPAGWHLGDVVAAERVAHPHRRWDIADTPHRLAHAEPVEHREHVRPELNAVADHAEFRRALKQPHAPPCAPERQRHGGAAKPAADDDDGIGPGRHATST